MALFSQHTKITNKNMTTMNATALMVFLLFFLISTLVHAEHSTEHTLNADQQDCYLCHQGVDTPPDLPQLQIVCVADYSVNIHGAVCAQFIVSNFVQPPLRAPPVFSVNVLHHFA
jgi:hypothetical protein